jgi:transposase
MAAYVVAEIDVTNVKPFDKEYVPPAAKAITDGGGKYTVCGGKTAAFYGEPPKPRIAIMAFESIEKAKAAFNSSAYKEAKETFAPGASVSIVARRHDLNANMLFTWRRQLAEITTLPAGEAVTFVPATITAEAALSVSPASSVAGRMEIVLAGGDRVIVGTDVDPAALARVVKILLRR